MTKFIAKKKYNIPIIKIIIIILSYIVLKYIYTNIKLTNNEKEFIDLISKDSTYANLYKINETNILNKIFKNFLKIDINNPINMLKERFIYTSSKKENITKPSVNVEENPIIYIYNTHQKEEYDGTYLEEYNISPGVLMASYILEKKLEQYGIATLVESTDIYKHMEQYGHTNAYSTTEQITARILNKYPNLKLIIDLHRDSPTRNYTTTSINNKNYAKVMFVQGTNYLGYEQNKKIVEILNNKLNKYYKTLSKGIYEKKDHFNQYLNNNMILIEVGGYQNTIEEVTNTLDALAHVIKEYINEKN